MTTTSRATNELETLPAVSLLQNKHSNSMYKQCTLLLYDLAGKVQGRNESLVELPECKPPVEPPRDTQV
eukprot:2744087-Ditylum_brightwellii.AAC.2